MNSAPSCTQHNAMLRSPLSSIKSLGCESFLTTRRPPWRSTKDVAATRSRASSALGLTSTWTSSTSSTSSLVIDRSDPPEPPAGLVECGLHSYRPRERIAADFERFLLKAPTKGIHKYRSRLTDLCQQPGLLRETNYSILDFEY